MSQQFKVGDHVILEMSDGKAYRCVVIEFNWPSMALQLDDEQATDDPDWQNGDEVKIELEAVN